MFGTELRERAPRRLRYTQPDDRHFALVFALLAFGLHTYAVAVELTKAAESVTLNSSPLPLLFLLTELGLLLNVVGLRLRKAAGALVSPAGLSIALLAHAIWYLQSRPILEAVLSNPFYGAHPEAAPPHPLGLLGATWVNLVVLGMTCILFVRVAGRVFGTSRAASDLKDLD